MTTQKKHDYIISVEWEDGATDSIRQIMSFHMVGSWADYFLHQQGCASITITKAEYEE